MPDRPPIPRALSIAGSDSGGGAGIQADLKAFACCGVHGMTAITAITAQNTVEVASVEPISPEMIVAQVRAVVDDIGVDAVKIGMLGTRETIDAVVEALDLLPEGTPVVLDPVMVAESGAELLDPAAREALVTKLVPRVTVVTPNVAEARALVAEGRRAQGEERTPGVHGVNDERSHRGATSDEQGDDVEQLARAVHALGPDAVVITGGHREEVTDVFYDGERLIPIPGERHPDGAAHGSGCTHSSALAAHLAKGDDALTAARAAKRIAAAAVRSGLRQIGSGAGPVDVFERGTSTVERGVPALP